MRFYFIFARLMSRGKNILSKDRFALTIDRLCHQIIEEYGDFSDMCLVGIQESGVLVSDRIHARLHEIMPEKTIKYGKLDISFYRDDFRTREEPIRVSDTDLEFSIEGLRVLLVDDVLYTGRTIHAAIAALQDFGRPAQVELLVLVDRRFNRHLPIKSDFTGISVDALDEAYVRVEWEQTHGCDRVLLYSGKRKKQ